MLDKTIRKQLGYLLWLERANQEKEIRWVVKKMKTEISSVDFAEHGKGHMNWNFYEEPSSGSWRYLRSLQATLANPTEVGLEFAFHRLTPVVCAFDVIKDCLIYMVKRSK